MSAEARVKQLGLVLPQVPSPVANYLPYRIAGNLLFLAGQGPRDEKGNTLSGKVGAEVSVEEGYRRARLIGLQLLSTMRTALGSLDRVDTILKMLVMVNAVPDFKDQPKVANGMSDLFVEVFGDNGKRAAPRSAWARCRCRFRSKSKELFRSSRKRHVAVDGAAQAHRVPQEFGGVVARCVTHVQSAVSTRLCITCWAPVISP